MDDKIISVRKETVKRINDTLNELAESPEQDRGDFPWIVFWVDNTEYAVKARYVLGVAILYEIVPYADAPAYCPGVIWDRNGIIRLLDLRVLLGRGDCRSSDKENPDRIPMIVIIKLGGIRRGMIVDKLSAPECVYSVAEEPVSADRAQSVYVKGLIQYDSQKIPALVISPESFSTLEFESQDVKIDWKRREELILN